MSARDATPRDLLFGLLALQVGLIDQDRLVLAFGAWSRSRGSSMAEILVEQGAIDRESRSLLEGMARKQLELHGGDAEKSLAAVGLGPSTRQRLIALGDTDLTHSLGAVPLPSTEDGAPFDPDATISVGTSTGQGQRFRVLRPHAQGGLGAVFVALDSELNREVALKRILDHHADDPTSRARFLIEAEITGGLEHPGIVPVYGLGHHANGRPYYAMRFIRGDSLKEAVAAFHADGSLKDDPGQRSLALRKLLRRFVDVCNAIDYAHGRGVLHRDLKPGNVIVGRHGETLVVDWGLAKPLGRSEPASATGERTLVPSSSSGSAETLPGSAVGTPAYMSPEQAAGDLERLGPRSDVYSLGATLYCLLTGQPPFEGKDIGPILRDVQKGNFPPPRQVDPSIDRALEAVCLKAMAVGPDDRHATARALADDVERWAADEPVSAWREPFTRRAGRWARRHRTGVTALAAAVLMASVGLAAVLAVQTRARRALALANGRLTVANDQLRRSDARARSRFDLAKKAVESYYTGASEDVLLKQPELEGLRKRLLRTALDFYRELGADLDADREAGLDPRARGELARAGFRVAIITQELGGSSDALAAFGQALGALREMMRLDPGDVEARISAARCLNRMAWVELQSGRPDESMQHHREARAIVEPLLAERPGDPGARDQLAWNLQGSGLLEMRAGRHDESRRMLQEAREIRQDLARAGPDNLEWQTSLSNVIHDLGVLAANSKHVDEALGFYNEALELKKKLADAHPELSRLQDDLAGIDNDLANVHQGRRDGQAEAMRLYRESLAIREKVVRAHPTVSSFRSRLASNHYNLGLALANQGRWADATDSFRRARAIDEALAKADPAEAEYRRDLAQVRFSLGYVSRRLGRSGEAAEAFRGAREAWERLSRAEPSNVEYRQQLALSIEGLAGLLQSLGRAEEALASQREALEVRRRLARERPGSGPYQDQLASGQFSLAECLKATGRLEEARRVQLEAMAVREDLVRAKPDVASYNESLADGHREIARLEAGAGLPAEALKRLEQAGAIYDRLAAARPGEPDRSKRADFQLVLGLALEGSGDLAGALRAYDRSRELTEKMPTLFSANHFHLATVYARLGALAARRGPSPGPGRSADPEALASKAVDELRLALAARYALPSRLRTDPNLDSLRSRPDFRLLLMDVGFPAEPFAGK